MVMEDNMWREIDRELRSIAKRQRALEAEEAALLCVVARQQIWRQFGCATMLEYLEMIFGYGPKVGHERVRVAMAIEALPELRDPHVETHAAARHAETLAPHVETHVTARHLETRSRAYSTAVMRAEAKQALQKLGFKPPISSKCVDAALASRPAPATLEQLIRAALQQSR